MNYIMRYSLLASIFMFHILNKMTGQLSPKAFHMFSVN